MSINSSFPNISPLGYGGINKTNPPQLWTKMGRAPTTGDYRQFSIGDEWEDNSVNPIAWYKLSSKDANIAIWQKFIPSISSAVSTINSISPDGSGNFSINAGSNVTVTPGANSVTIASSAGGAANFVTNSGTATESSGTLNIVGGTSITTSGTGSTVTVAFNPSSPINPSSGGTGVSSPTAHTFPVAEGASPFNFLGPLTDGQLLIGSTGADPVPATITAGSGISIINGSGSITIGSTETQGFTSVNIQTFTTPGPGTYTPTTGMKYCIVECVGAGGGGGGTPSISGTQFAAGTGGGAGEYARGKFSAATIGVSQFIFIGSAGSPVAGVDGPAGGPTYLNGPLFITANGGSGGKVGVAVGVGGSDQFEGGAGGTGGVGGEVRSPGNNGGTSYCFFPTAGGAGVLIGSVGADSQYGSGGVAASPLSGQLTFPGQAALGYGAGGSGAISNPAAAGGALQGAEPGGQGSGGIMIITEFI